MNKYNYNEAIELNKNGLSIVKISKKLEIPKTNLQKFLSYHKIDSNAKHFYKYDKNEVIKLNKEGLSVKDICKKLNAPYTTIYSIIKRNGNDINITNCYDYDEIKKMAENGFTVFEISEKIGINKKYLYELSSSGIFDIIKESERKYEKILELNKNGKTIREISNDTGIKHETIYAYFWRNKIEFKEDNGILTGYGLEPMNEYKAYMLGVIFGDGSLGKGDDKCIEIGMNDFDVLDCINKNVFDGKISINTRTLKSGKTHYRLGIHNSNIWKEAVEKFGLCNNKSAVMKFPEIEEQYLSHFVRGLVDSDGSFFLDSNKLSFSYGSRSFDFIKILKEVLIKYCNVNNIKISELLTKQNNKFYIIRWCNKKDPLAIGQWIYKNSNNNRGERKFTTWFNYFNL